MIGEVFFDCKMYYEKRNMDQNSTFKLVVCCLARVLLCGGKTAKSKTIQNAWLVQAYASSISVPTLFPIAFDIK